MIIDSAGVILAGGQSRRFGANKALAEFRGAPLIQRVTDLIGSLFSEKLLITNTPETYSFLAWPTACDRFPDHGPLAGIHAALSVIHSPRAFITACDMPFLTSELIKYLCTLATSEWDVVLPWLDDGPEPLCAVYNKKALPIITDNLRNGQKKISQSLERMRVRKVVHKDIMKIAPDLNVFCNINRCEDLQQCRP